jgi:hypothetical protein
MEWPAPALLGKIKASSGAFLFCSRVRTSDSRKCEKISLRCGGRRDERKADYRTDTVKTPIQLNPFEHESAKGRRELL